MVKFVAEDWVVKGERGEDALEGVYRVIPVVITAVRSAEDQFMGNLVYCLIKKPGAAYGGVFVHCSRVGIMSV